MSLIRAALDREPGLARSYTANRIREGFDVVASILGELPDIPRNAAYDVGCGAGFDSFALATQFDRVLAIDPDRAAITEAVKLLRVGGAPGLEFRRSRAEDLNPVDQFDYVHCNLMSHNSSSREELLGRLARSLHSGGALFYSEINEGYAPMELERAIEIEDAAEVGLRLGQVVNGFLGAGFRFYWSSSAGDVASRFGLMVRSVRSQSWREMATSSYWLLVRSGADDLGMAAASQSNVDHPVADAFHRTVRQWRRGEPSDRHALESLARSPGDLNAFAWLLLMADAARDAVMPHVTGRSIVTRAMHRVRPPAAPRVDWPAIRPWFGAFVAATPGARLAS